MTTSQTSVRHPAEYTELLGRLATVHDLHAASAVLGWDQMTYLPAGAGGLGVGISQRLRALRMSTSRMIVSGSCSTTSHRLNLHFPRTATKRPS